jgi:serine/threonine-protein kinase
MPVQLIAPRPDGSRPAPRIMAASPRHLPADVLRDASVRLGILSLVVAVLWTAGNLVGHALSGRWTVSTGTDVITIASVLVSIALFFYTRRTTRDPKEVLDLGLVYLVIMSLALGLLFHWNGPQNGRSIEPQISWVGVLLLMVAAILPSSTARMLIAGTMAVAVNPFAMLIGWHFGVRHLDSAWDAPLMHYPDFLLVGVAVVISRVVTQLGRQVGTAREMGSYQLGELLGGGGLGEVYRATHRMLARPAAIKLIRPETLGGWDEAAAQLAVKRFHREAQAAAKLRSPHTVEIYDFGVTEDQTLYFVMELLDGMDLAALVRRHGALPAARVIHIITQVCESLEEAHRSGLVHRDIKPANIHLGRLGLDRDFVKVLDFGLVKPFSAASVEASLATVAGQTPGTPAYMAPEMSLSEAVDGRADIYALGCVAYFLLTGKLVFEAETAIQMVARHLQYEPLSPSLRTDNHIPQSLDMLVLRCLAKDPGERPQTAAELARALADVDVLAWGNEEAARWWGASETAPAS